MDKQNLGVGRAFVPTASDPQAVPPVPASIPDAWNILASSMNADPEYAWAWHCNLAVPIMDAIDVTHEQANVAAAHLMQHLWGCDITTHPMFKYGKSEAQAYAEFRIAMDAEEDAQGIEAGTVETARLDAQHESPVRQDAPVFGSPTTTLADSDGDDGA